MEDRKARLFCNITFALNLLVLLLSSTGVISVPATTPTIMDVMRNDTRLCDASKVLYDSDYVKLCSSLPYSTSPWNYTSETVDQFLCLGVYDTAYKICQYSSRLQLHLNSTATFNSYVEKFVPTGRDKTKGSQEEKFCKDNFQEFKSLYNKTNLLWRPLIEKLNTPYACIPICFGFNDHFHPLCAVLAWIKSIDDSISKLNKTGTAHDTEISDVKVSNSKIANQPNGKASEVKTFKPTAAETKPETEVKEKQRAEQDTIPKAHLKNNNNNVKGSNLNASNVSVEHTFSEVQADNQAFHEENAKNIAVNSAPQAPLVNNAAGNVPNKKIVNEGNAEESDKKQDVDDSKTLSSTLSENTQDKLSDSYDGNPDDDIGDIDDDTIQQPIDTENRNENHQEVFEKKNNLQYSNIRTEDDSHFFTYFTVITVACIAGYIGYHNKQKIFAIVLEGRRSRSNRGRRRPSTASYRKLDCTLEEAVTSQCNANVTHVIY